MMRDMANIKTTGRPGAAAEPRRQRRAAGRWWNAGRMALGGYFVAMAGVNAAITLPNAETTYQEMADLSWPGFAWIPEQLVTPIAVPFTIALIGWELGVAALLLSKGRLVQIGLLAVLVQVIGLAPFLSWYELPNLATAVVVVVLAQRDYDRSMVDMAWALVGGTKAGESKAASFPARRLRDSGR